MNPFNIIDSIKQHGTTGLLVVAIIYLHTRLNGVEDKLYRCYDQAKYTSIQPTTTPYLDRQQVFAILPSEIKIKRTNASIN